MKRRQWLADIRSDAELTQEQAADLAGLERSTYTKAEIGYPVRVNTAKRIASALQFDWTLFFDDVCDESGQSMKASNA